MSESESSDNPDVIDLNETNSTQTPETDPDADEEAEPDTEATDEPAGEEEVEEAEPDTDSEEADEEESVSDSEAESETTEAEADAEAEPTREDPDGTTDTAHPDEDPEGGESNNNPAPDSADEDMSESEPSEQSDDKESASESPSANSEAFKAIIEAGDFQDSLDSVSVLVDECKVHLNEDGFSIRAVDPANVAMVDLDLDPAAFDHYVADGGIIGVNLSRFKDIISMASSGDLIHLHLDEKTRKLNIEFDGLSYTLALIDPDSIRQEPDIPDLDLSSTTVLEGSQINRGITAADMVSDHIRLRVDESEEAFYIEAEGDTDDVDLKLERDDLIDMSPGVADSLYSLDYLKDMNKAFPKNAEITAELGEEFPVKFHYGLAEGQANVTYMLAPRIQSD